MRCIEIKQASDFIAKDVAFNRHMRCIEIAPILIEFFEDPNLTDT